MNRRGLSERDRYYYDTCHDFEDMSSFEILDKYRWGIALQFLRKLSPPFQHEGGFRILDVGAGSGKASFLYHSKADGCYLVDHSFSQIARARRNISGLRCSRFLLWEMHMSSHSKTMFSIYALCGKSCITRRVLDSQSSSSFVSARNT